MDRLPTKDVQTLNLGGEWRAAQSVRICRSRLQFATVSLRCPTLSICIPAIPSATLFLQRLSLLLQQARNLPAALLLGRTQKHQKLIYELIFLQHWVGSFPTSHFAPALLCLISERRPCKKRPCNECLDGVRAWKKERAC